MKCNFFQGCGKWAHKIKKFVMCIFEGNPQEAF